MKAVKCAILRVLSDIPLLQNETNFLEISGVVVRICRETDKSRTLDFSALNMDFILLLLVLFEKKSITC